MIVVDANLLLYAYVPSLPHHPVIRPWLEKTFAGTRPVRVAWVTLLAFLRISTDSRAFQRPLSAAEAVAIISEWFEQPLFGVLGPGERHWEILKGLLTAGQVNGPPVMDAHLAALAIEHGAILCTTDADFRRFPGLQLQNPLQSQ